MKEDQNNFAYIDGANLHRGTRDLGWHIDYRRFRVWLSDKYSVKRVYLFLGLIPRFKDMYTHLPEVGYTLIFKEVTYDEQGGVKGNCDADLVLQAARDFYEHNFDNAVLVSSDGDYASLVKFFHERDKLLGVLSPSNKCFILLQRTGAKITYLDTQQSILISESQKEKAPDGDETP